MKTIEEEIKNTYLASPNKNKASLYYGKDLGAPEGKLLLIAQEIYVLISMGSSFRAYLSNKLEEMGFQ